jgi:hypothetical protein
MAARWKAAMPRSATPSDPTFCGSSSSAPKRSARRRRSEPNQSPTLPKSEEPKDEQDDNDGANDVDDLVHEILSSVWMGQAMELPEPDGSNIIVRAAGRCVGTVPHREAPCHAWQGAVRGPGGWPGSEGGAVRAQLRTDELRASGMTISMQRFCWRTEAVIGLVLPPGYVG